jgi:hypothetical protein
VDVLKGRGFKDCEQTPKNGRKWRENVRQGLKPTIYYQQLTTRLRAYPQIVAPVSRPAVLAASKPPDVMYAGLETRMTAALESGATKTQFADKL